MADTATFDIYDDKGTKVVDGKPSPDVISSLTSNSVFSGYWATYAGKTAKLALPDIVTTPGKPAVTVTAGDGKLTYTITPATGDGAAERSYVVSHSTDGKTFTDVETSTVTGDITGLTNDTVYTVKVTAKNAGGSSTESDTVTGTPTVSKPRLGNISTTANSATIELS